MSKVEVMAEGSAASIGGSRRVLPRPRLRRLTALSRHSSQPVWLPWLRRSDVGECPGFVVAENGIEDGQQLARRRRATGRARSAKRAQQTKQCRDRRDPCLTQSTTSLATTLSAPLFASPVGSAITAPVNSPQDTKFHIRIASNALKIAASSEECGINLSPAAKGAALETISS